MTPDESFCAAYWSFLRGVRVFEPLPTEFGIEPQLANVLARQCETHYRGHEH